MTTYPIGDIFTPVSFTTSAGYISADTLYIDACHRWLMEIASHPELFYGMPVRRSMLQSERIDTIFGSSTGATFREIGHILESANMINFPGFWAQNHRGSLIEGVLLAWMFDDYILNNGDLNTLITETTEKIETHRQCLQGVPPFTSSMTSDEINAINRQEEQCATVVDPRLEQFFGFITE